MSELNLEPPSKKRIAMSALAAAGLAIVLLVTTVLPAEYGIDPLGTGDLFGLNQMGQPSRTLEIGDVLGGNQGVREVEIPDFGEPVPLPNPEIHQDEGQAARSESMEISIPAEGETEIKTVLRQGKMLMYSWQVDQGTIYADFHGHDPAVGNQFWVRYREQQEGAGHSGSLVAPFDGEHGWYWLNYNEFPVTVRLSVTGYYEDIIDYSDLF
jgi:hypothetical protein